MKNEVRSILRNTALVLSVAFLSTQLAEAGRLPRVEAAQADAAAQAMAATQQAQQANDQAMAAAQAASAQAVAAAQAAAADTGTVGRNPNQRPLPVPLSPNAPVPAQIATAHTVFLTNTGADPNFPFDENAAFNKVFAAFNAWGHYQFVTSPAQADLVFQLHDLAPITDVSGSRAGVYATTSPSLQLTILDAKTNISLWTLTSPVYLAIRQKTRDKWFAASVTNLVSRVKVLAGESLSPAETANLTHAPANHGSLFFFLLTGVLVGAAIGGSIILKDKYDKSVSDQKSALCASNPVFCTP